MGVKLIMKKEFEIYQDNKGNVYTIATELEELLLEDIVKLHSIIKEVREILKFHLSNPSGTKNGWHIDIWNSEDISKLNEYLGILDKEKKK